MYNRFPSDSDRKKEWLVAMRRDCWIPSKHSKIFSDHFLEKYFDRTGQQNRLKDGAVPTRFKKFPQHLKKVRL